MRNANKVKRTLARAAAIFVLGTTAACISTEIENPYSSTPVMTEYFHERKNNRDIQARIDYLNDVEEEARIAKANPSYMGAVGENISDLEEEISSKINNLREPNNLELSLSNERLASLKESPEYTAHKRFDYTIKAPLFFGGFLTATLGTLGYLALSITYSGNHKSGGSNGRE